MSRKEELKSIIAAAQRELAEMELQYAVNGDRVLGNIIKGARKQVQDLQAQLNDILAKERKQAEAMAEAKAVAERQQVERELREHWEAIRAADREAARLASEKVAKERSEQETKQRIEQENARRLAREAAKLSREAHEREAAKKEAEKEKERQRLQGVEMVAGDKKGGTFLLSVPGYGSIEVKFIPEVK